MLTRPGELAARSSSGSPRSSRFYVGVIVCLRASGLLVTDHAIPRLHKRQVVGVFATMVVGFVATGDASRSALVAANTTEPTAEPGPERAATATSSCASSRSTRSVWPASHNAMSSSAYNFFGAEHTITIPEQLNAGVRFLMLDVYYGYDDDGLVRTNLAGGVDRKTLEKERGKDAVRALDRMGALTGTADTSGKKQDLYFCHDFCELGAVQAADVLAEIKRLPRPQPHRGRDPRLRGLRPAEGPAAGARRRRPAPPAAHARPGRDDDDDDARPRQAEATRTTTENPRRLIVLSEKHGDAKKWLRPDVLPVPGDAVHVHRRSRTSTARRTAATADNPLFLDQPLAPPRRPARPGEAGQGQLEEDADRAVPASASTRRRLLPNAIAVDFTAIGDLYKTREPVQRRGRDRDRRGGRRWTRSSATTSTPGELTDAQLAESSAGIRRLPKVSAEDALQAARPARGRSCSRATGIQDFERVQRARDPDDATTRRRPPRPPRRPRRRSRATVTMRAWLDAQDVETVERVIAAPPEAIFAYLVDPRKHREIDGSGHRPGREGRSRRRSCSGARSACR